MVSYHEVVTVFLIVPTPDAHINFSSKRGSNDTAFVHATCIEDTIDTSPVGSRIIISAPAGAGKSALSSHYTRGWCKRQFGHR